MRFAFAIPLLVLGLPLVARAEEEVPVDCDGAHDSPLLKRYPGSVMTEITEKEFEDFKFPLADSDEGVKSKVVSGSFYRAYYRYPPKASCTQVLRNYENAFKAASLAAHKGGNSPQDDISWAESKWVSAEGAVKGKGGSAFLVVTCDEANDAAWRNTGWAWVVVAKEMEQKVELDASAMEEEITKSGHVALYGIHFASGKSDVTPDSAKALEEVGKLLAQEPGWKLRVEGHTDDVGEKKANLELSKKRAAAVKAYLVSKVSVKAAQLVTEGYGDGKPVAPNDSDGARAKNRRVELVKL